MPRVSAKRQITLPATQCKAVGIKPGDEFRSFVADRHITIVRQKVGSARGCLGHLQGDDTVSDQQSRQDAIEYKRANVET